MTENKTAAKIHPQQAQYEAHWMPFTSNREFKANPRIIVSAKDCYFRDDQGRQILDGLSGLWTCGAGHCRREISEAVSKQINTLDYSPAFQFGHPGSFELANRLSHYTPENLNHFFFTCSGSEAVDSALKIARAYWRQVGQPSKTKLIGRVKGYHGVNFGGISVGGMGPNRAPFGQVLDSDHLSSTLLPKNAFAKGQPKHGAELADQFSELIVLHDASNIAALIIEPMAGSGGVLPPPVGYLERLRYLCDQHNILLIFDEVICAFGRMGTKTGAEAFSVTPDIMTFAKQVTNGTQPLGGVAVRDDIYQCFMQANNPEYLLEFPHGYTYSAHPVACAAALASLDILEQDQLINEVQKLAPKFEKTLHQLKGMPFVTDIRNYGLAGGITLKPKPGEPALRPYQVAMKCWKKGFYVRYGGDTIQLAPPFTINESEIDSLVSAVADSLNELNSSSRL